MKLSFHGAARSVTGSRHLLEMPGNRILLDCGLFQGQRQEADVKTGFWDSTRARSKPCCCPMPISTIPGLFPYWANISSAGMCT
jgi:hypothetical protein